jgi:archaetidylinositol phosphate synthase
VDKNEFFTTWSNLHGGAKIEGIVKTWLQISYASAKFLSKLRVTPNLLTFAGLFFAIALWQFANSWAAALFLVLSLFFDGIDGSLAILQKKTSKFGAFTDSFVDRISEVFWALALYKLGAPAALSIRCTTCNLCSGIHSRSVWWAWPQRSRNRNYLRASGAGKLDLHCDYCQFSWP